jgi:hypothetical protein
VSGGATIRAASTSSTVISCWISLSGFCAACARFLAATAAKSCAVQPYLVISRRALMVRSPTQVSPIWVAVVCSPDVPMALIDKAGLPGT